MSATTAAAQRRAAPAARRLAVLDRGEAAMRVLDAVAELNRERTGPPLTTVAFHSAADAAAWFVREADEAVEVGPEHLPADSPGLFEALVSAAVDLVWLGRGTLPARATLARRCEEAGIDVVGPDSATLWALADPDEVARRALAVGVTSAAPGADDPAGARRVEIQVVADGRGTTWAVGTRDCTLRRGRHKVVEETGSAALAGEVEQALKDAAVRVTEALAARAAIRVTFVVDPVAGGFRLADVDARRTVEHPVTEATTGLDLVKLQLRLALGGRLEEAPPPGIGHAVAVRVRAVDPDHGFAPSPGRLALLRMPIGTGIRVYSGLAEGDEVSADDPVVAEVVAWAHDRDEALDRLLRGLAQATVVVDGGSTDQSFLLSLLSRDEVRAGTYDSAWLDGLVARGALTAAPDPAALLAAAVAAYDADQAVEEAAFHASAARGRPLAPREVGHRMVLGYRGTSYPATVYRTGARDYRFVTGGLSVDVAVDHLGALERRLTVAGHQHRAVVVVRGSTAQVGLRGTTHRVVREDGGVVRAETPAFVVSVPVRVGDDVAAGDPVVVLESMKMETTVLAPFAGRVAAVEVSSNQQVEIGAPLLRVRPAGGRDEPVGPPVRLDLSDLATDDASARGDVEHLIAALRGFQLGYDMDPATARRLPADLRRLAATSAPDDAALLAAENQILDLFADVAALYRPHPERPVSPESIGEGRSTQEHLLAYLQWLDPVRAGLPDSFRMRLQRALARYGLRDLARGPGLESALVWMFRSFRRVSDVVPVVTNVLERRLRNREVLAPRTGPGMRELLDRLASASAGRYEVVADLARDVRFRYVDEPLLEQVVAEVYEEIDGVLDALAADPDGPGRDRQVERLVWCPQPMRGRLLAGYRTGAPEFQRTMLEVQLRRFYRIRPLRDVRPADRAGRPLVCADYDHEGLHVHVVAACAALDELPAVAAAVAGHLRDLPADAAPVVDLMCWRPGERPGVDDTAAHTADLLREADFGRRLHRLDVTVTSAEGPGPDSARTQHLTYRQPDGGGGFVEDLTYRNLHPMLGKRLELWRLANFHLRRLRSPEDVYLFEATARDNPRDVRLFALAEVRDLTEVRDDRGEVVALPRLERTGAQAIASMHRYLSTLPPRTRPADNRVVLYVRPPWTLPQPRWRDYALSLAPLAAGVHLDRVVLRVRLPQEDGSLADSVLQVEGIGMQGVTVRAEPATDARIRPLTPYRQKVLRALRAGAPYPFEIIAMLTPPAGSDADFPHGRFVEHDLDGDRLVPVARPWGENTANVVVGVLTSDVPRIPEGMSRVVLLGDPTRGLGNLAEPECRRINAALDLAEEMGVPLEWYALSSGAKIAMDSGTENMDWISATLRRIIEFTQAGHEVNVVVTGINVGAQPYWNAEATMLMHTKGILVMTPDSAMVLTGKTALDYSGGVSADDNLGIGGYERVMGPNGQGQYWAPDLRGAIHILLRHYEHTYVVPGERFPRRWPTTDPVDRDVRTSPHAPVAGTGFTSVGDVFSPTRNGDRKKPFDMRSVMRAVTDRDAAPLERWARWREAESAIVWDARVGGIPVCAIGLESRTVPRRGFVAADGPPSFTSGTLFPQSSRKVARAVNAASGNRPLLVLANLSGFDGSPESMRRWQLEYGAEIGRAVTNFDGPIVFVVVSRYHGGAFVVFSKTLNPGIEMAAVEGSFASVIGGAPAAAVVFARDVQTRTDRDPRVVALREEVAAATDGDAQGLRGRLHETVAAVRSEKLGEVAGEFDGIHSIQRAQQVGSVDHIIAAVQLRPYVVEALERGMARTQAALRGDGDAVVLPGAGAEAGAASPS